MKRNQKIVMLLILWSMVVFIGCNKDTTTTVESMNDGASGNEQLWVNMTINLGGIFE